MGWPIFGETLNFIWSARRGCPEKFIFDRMNKYSPSIFKTSLFGEKIVVFCGASGNKYLLSSDKFVTPWLPPFFRKVLFSPGIVATTLQNECRSHTIFLMKPEVLQQKFVGVMDYISRQHIEQDWAPYREVLASELARKYIFSVACLLVLSIKDPKEVARLKDLFEGLTAGLSSIPINFPGTSFHRAIKYGTLLRKELLTTIKQRKTDLFDMKSDLAISSKDILSQILLSKDQNGKFHNDMDVADRVIGVLFASYHTTSTVLTHIVKYLAEIPHVYAEVLKEQLEIANNKNPGELLNWENIQKMKYSWCVANEAMRLAPPGNGTFREAKADFTFAGFTIPKGYKAYWTVHSTNKNPEYFENPEKFDPSRFQGNGPIPYSFAPFGGGTHICAGREFARIEILVFMHNLVTQFELEKAYWTVHSTQKNPEYFENPKKFDPSRFQGNGPAPHSFAPFGGGTHICPGREFARIEILIFIHNLVTQFELEKVIPNEKTLYKFGPVPANGLPIHLHRRNPQTN